MWWTTSPNATSTLLENLLNSTLSNLQHCECEKETEFGFCSVKQNTVEEFECECSRYGKKSTCRVAFLSLRPQLAQDPQDVISLLFHSLSVSNKLFQRLPQNWSGSRQFHSVDQYCWMDYTVRKKDRRLDCAKSKNRSSSTWRKKSSLTAFIWLTATIALVLPSTMRNWQNYCILTQTNKCKLPQQPG